MKKFFILIFTIFILSTNAFGKNIPLYKTSINEVGIGIINLPQKFSIYENPSFKSRIITEYKIGDFDEAKIDDTDYSDNFIIFNPNKKYAYMTVLSESDSPGWFEICYDQKKGLTGWVAPERYEFYPWYSFFTKYGKLNGLYVFRDTPVELKRLHGQPDSESQILNTFKDAKNIRVQIYRGNWALVRVYDLEGKLMIGWIKWRNEDGRFNYFPVLK